MPQKVKLQTVKPLKFQIESVCSVGFLINRRGMPNILTITVIGDWLSYNGRFFDWNILK